MTFFLKIIAFSFWSATCFGCAFFGAGLVAPLLLSLIRGDDLFLNFDFNLFAVGFVFGGALGLGLYLLNMFRSRGP